MNQISIVGIVNVIHECQTEALNQGADNEWFPAAEDFAWMIDQLGGKPTREQWLEALSLCGWHKAIVFDNICADAEEMATATAGAMGTATIGAMGTVSTGGYSASGGEIVQVSAPCKGHALTLDEKPTPDQLDMSVDAMELAQHTAPIIHLTAENSSGGAGK